MKKTYLKIALDIIMVIVFALLFNKSALGLAFHEIAGLAIGAAFIIHKLLNAKWIKCVTQNIFNKKLLFKTRLNYILDVVLLICFAFIIISGILISKVLFPNIDIANESTFKMLHISISYATLMLIGIHIGLHWSWAMDKIKRMFNTPNNKKVLSMISTITAIAIFAFGSYNIYSTGYFEKVFMPESISSGHHYGNRSLNESSKNYTNTEIITASDTSKVTDTEAQNGSGSGSGNRNRAKSYNSSISIQDAFNSLIKYLSIVSAFTVLAYYIQKSLEKKEKIKDS